MRISRIYTDQPLNAPGNIALQGQAAHYLSKVLRLKAGMPVIVFNGDGFDYDAVITAVGKQDLELDIRSRQTNNSESPLYTVLGLGLSRGERMDVAIQKSTELGVSEIVPLLCVYSEPRLQGDRLQKKMRHWQQIAISACEQSGRAVVPAIREPLSLQVWSAATDCELKLIFHPGPVGKINSQGKVSRVALAVGPEGGFSDQELGAAVSQGFQTVGLGPRILRTETAPVAALAALQLQWGDFSL